MRVLKLVKKIVGFGVESLMWLISFILSKYFLLLTNNAINNNLGGLVFIHCLLGMFSVFELGISSMLSYIVFSYLLVLTIVSTLITFRKRNENLKNTFEQLDVIIASLMVILLISRELEFISMKYFSVFSLLLVLAIIIVNTLYLVTCKVRTWKMYIVFLLITPILSMLIIAILQQYIIDNSISNLLFVNFFKYGTVFLTVAIFNITAWFTSSDKLEELRLGLNGVLVIVSTFSYSFFISDILSELIYNTFQHEMIISIEAIKVYLENIIRWSLLPYLLGSIQAIFIIELKKHNRKVESKNPLKTSSNTTVSDIPVLGN
jgi:hypothetical protein